MRGPVAPSIAEELDRTYPEFVVYDNINRKDNKSEMVPHSITYDKLSALLVAQIQQLKKIVEHQGRVIAAMAEGKRITPQAIHKVRSLFD